MAGKNARREGRGPSRAQRARSHVEEMARRFSGEIAASAKGVRAYDGAPAVSAAASGVPRVSVADEDTASAVLARGRGLACGRCWKPTVFPIGRWRSCNEEE